MILKISLRAKASVPKTLVKQKLRLHSLYLVQLLSLEGNSVICILFLDFVRFPISDFHITRNQRLSYNPQCIWFSHKILHKLLFSNTLENS